MVSKSLGHHGVQIIRSPWCPFYYVTMVSTYYVTMVSTSLGHDGVQLLGLGLGLGLGTREPCGLVLPVSLAADSLPDTAMA